LFDSIRTKRLGNSHSDPFQILVKKGSRESNIVDVGYGVSQVLPIVAECISVGDGTRILMQQPEVHLHPRAQAALGNLISILSNRKKQHYVIETHSDYLIDRIRYETIRKSIKSKDVGIIYLEKEKTDTKVFQIGLDSDGNVMNAPESYREFFIREQFRLLGLEETV
jgi:predicted ATPase